MKKYLFLFLLAGLFSMVAKGQTGNHVFSVEEVVNFSEINLSTSAGASWSTDRNAIPGYFSASGNAIYTGAADNLANINGYVKYYSNGIPATSFTYPVGTGTDLRSLSITGAIPADGIFATAWIAGDPTNTNDPTTPNAGTHAVTSFGTGISGVSTVGQWDWQDISSNAAGMGISVSIPDVSALGTAPNLRLVGWNGTQWVNLSITQGNNAASGNTENSILQGNMIAGITAIGIGRANFTISGTVFNDNNAATPDGMAVASVAATLFADDGTTVVATATTDASGNYSFPDLSSANYIVAITLPAGFQHVGSTDAITPRDGRTAVNLGSADITGVNFGINQPPVAVNDALTDQVQGAVTFPNILSNDSDPNNGVLTADGVSLVAPAGATAIVTNAQGNITGFNITGQGKWTYNSATGSLTFSPQAGFSSNPTPINYTVKDAAGLLSNSAQVSITYNFSLSISTQTNVKCPADNDGSATVTATGGVTPYTYAWAPSGGTAASATGLAVGTYTVTVTDNTGATQTATVNITSTTTLSTINTQPADQSADIGGSVSYTTTVSGGSGITRHQWQVSVDHGVTWNNLSNAGVYAGTSTDPGTNTLSSTLTITGVAMAMNGYLYRDVIRQDGASCTVLSGNANLTINPVADVSVIKTASSKSPVKGTNLTFTLKIDNDGPSEATDIKVLDELPGGYTFVSATASTGNYDNTTGIWTISNLLNGDQATLDIIVKVNASGDYTNNATVTAKESDPQLDNNTSTITPVPISAPIDLMITKRSEDKEVLSEETFDYDLEVRNSGAADATDVNVTDVLPNNLIFERLINPANGTADFDNTTQTLHWNMPTLPAGNTAKLTLTVRAKQPGQVNNTAIVKAAEDDPNLKNNASTDHKTIKAIHVYNVITPNGDGKNDVFFIRNLNAFETNQLIIVNRWQNIVYQVDNYKNDWGGGGLSDGTYFYVIKVKNGSSWIEEKGYLTILR